MYNDQDHKTYSFYLKESSSLKIEHLIQNLIHLLKLSKPWYSLLWKSNAWVWAFLEVFWHHSAQIHQPISYTLSSPFQLPVISINLLLHLDLKAGWNQFLMRWAYSFACPKVINQESTHLYVKRAESYSWLNLLNPLLKHYRLKSVFSLSQFLIQYLRFYQILKRIFIIFFDFQLIETGHKSTVGLSFYLWSNIKLLFSNLE